jgi:roadblock/LC7 domain-containing protein
MTEHDDYREHNGRISPSTLISLAGVVLSVVAGTWVLASKISTTKTDIMTQNASMKADFVAARTAIESRITALEARPTKETWTDGDMFRWATRLQRENPNLRVPEPPMKGDTPSR